MHRFVFASTLTLWAVGSACENDNNGSTAGEGASGGIVLTGDDSSGGIEVPGPGAVGKLDLPPSDGGRPDDPAASGCAKADFLFVIDNSGSMADEQANLIASFPGFIATITQTIAAQDYHIMAVPTDDGQAAGLSTKCNDDGCACMPAPICCQKTCELFGKDCNGFACDALPIGACDQVYGRGNIYGATGNRCPIADERRYMKADQPDLAGTFECVANIGTHGSGAEKPVLATLEAVSAALNGPGGCDEGFLRDDAILVVIIITDEEDDNAIAGEGTPGLPKEWHEQLIAAKHGDTDAVVVLGLVGDGNLSGSVCPPGGGPNMDGTGAEPCPRLQEFVDRFDNGVIGSVCATDYTPFFSEAVGVIDFACDVFVPVG
ncbi:hypothetical protein [Nannocystis bainbridge]|uniref:VWFA domain-containing protein n=1 Tax=Nannocystis bainbridge TaxID=2995303 RepID=A0ABT5DXL8_9BACT|nr:hypothetical protein [Nannocystis bainbridge]MDC0718311.1 hypothetical protein [Nannocystis bainbridge]